ncbi:MAG TPA: RTX toxin [Thermoanaerobaculia bacterium]
MKTASIVRLLRNATGTLGLAALGLLMAGGSALAAPPSSSTLAPGGFWLPQGPGPTLNGQTEGLEDGDVAGAIQTVAAHPRAAGTLYVGTVNGGVWKTTNAASQNVKWERLTDEQASNSVGALEFDPTDPAYKTLVAGIGRFSSLSSLGGARTGLLRTTDGGKTWTAIDGGGVLIEKNISGVAPRGNTLVIAVNTSTPFTFNNIGIWRSTNGGATFQQIAGGDGAATGLPGGVTYDLVGDPKRPNRLFTSVVFADLVGGVNGVYRSDDTGATWTKVSNPAMDALIVSSVTSNIEFAVGNHNNVYAAIANLGQLAGVFRSGDGGATWTAMDLPETFEGAPVGIHPGAQAALHLSLVADPTDPNIVYVGGDRQPLFNEPVGTAPFFPNSIGANSFTGRLFRGDASKPAGSQWAPLTHAGTASNSAPHSDSREMTFDSRGDLIETDDGGIYKRTNPRSASGDWFSLNGDLQITEIHSLSYDTLSNVVFAGTQDVGVPVQLLPSQTLWNSLQQGDGGDTAVDVVTTPGQSNRFTSNQNLLSFRKTFWDAGNNLLGFVLPALTVLNNGPRPVRQFVTPIALNGADPHRLVIGAANALYESLDQGANLFVVGLGVRTNGTSVDPIAYGAAGNPDALYVGATDRVFRRTAPAPAAVALVPTFPGMGSGRTVNDIVLDPDDASRVFVTNTAAVYMSADAGATWTNLTGNLPSFSPSTFRSLTYAPTPLGDALVLGTQTGIFYATEATGFSVWRRLGNGLPTVAVFDLAYDRGDDLLVAGTLGRGAWKLLNISTAVLGGGL